MPPAIILHKRWKYAFNIFWAAVIDDGCHIHPSQMGLLQAADATEKMLKYHIYGL